MEPNQDNRRTPREQTKMAAITIGAMLVLLIGFLIFDALTGFVTITTPDNAVITERTKEGIEIRGQGTVRIKLKSGNHNLRVKEGDKEAFVTVEFRRFRNGSREVKLVKPGKPVVRGTVSANSIAAQNDSIRFYDNAADEFYEIDSANTLTRLTSFLDPGSAQIGVLKQAFFLDYNTALAQEDSGDIVAINLNNRTSQQVSYPQLEGAEEAGDAGLNLSYFKRQQDGGKVGLLLFGGFYLYNDLFKAPRLVARFPFDDGQVSFTDRSYFGFSEPDFDVEGVNDAFNVDQQAVFSLDYENSPSPKVMKLESTARLAAWSPDSSVVLVADHLGVALYDKQGKLIRKEIGGALSATHVGWIDNKHFIIMAENSFWQGSTGTDQIDRLSTFVSGNYNPGSVWVEGNKAYFSTNNLNEILSGRIFSVTLPD